jgi:hypothetical protein
MTHRNQSRVILLTLATVLFFVLSPLTASAVAPAAERPDPNANECGGEWTPLQPGVGLCHDEFGDWECYSLWAYGRNVANYLCIFY